MNVVSPIADDPLQIDQLAGPVAVASDVALCPLPPRSESVKTARDFARATLRDWGMSTLFDDVGLVVSELVTNALSYGLSLDAEGALGAPYDPRSAVPADPAYPVQLSLLRGGSHVMCAVTDPSNRPPVLKEPDFFAERGRGLRLVESLSHEWGWTLRGEAGKVVWALFRVPARSESTGG